MKLFKKILIANRGEIAVRVIRSAGELGIRTVGVYSTADDQGLHVQLADEAYCLGESAELSETYLNIAKILDIAKRSGSEAIHPGYGFLAENPAFVKACEDAGIVFIGPNSRAIRLMGNKIESREFVGKAGIPMTAGLTGDAGSLIREAEKIPLPLLVKAAAGGGGKGMRIVHDLKELPAILETTSREAKSYFGDGTIYIEKYIEEPRHIEVQVIGDNHGNAVHLFERECSIQRRYQKIIEESPSPTITPEIRSQMGEAAVKIAKEIGYNNAGTVEFLVDKDLNFYFLEMNTRVQVEHPVTEMVTGIDIVREQILVAAGNPLSFGQNDLEQKGHAIECRIYAEDPANGFLPSPGKMTLYQEPGGEEIRIDTGIAGATTIHSFFDPMISKLIVWGEDREIAREKMIRALNAYVIHGIKTNIPYLTRVLDQDAYIRNRISTRYCDEHTDEINLLIQKEKQEIPGHLPVIGYLMYTFYHDLMSSEEEEFSVWKLIGYWRDMMDLSIRLDDQEMQIKVHGENKGIYKLGISGKNHSAELKYLEPGIAGLNVDGIMYEFYVSTDGKGNYFVSLNNHEFNITRQDVLIEEDIFGMLDQSGREGEIVSPMPGKVIKIAVASGQQVKQGDLLLIVEAMKMENNIISPKDGIVDMIFVQNGDMVDGSTELLALKENE